MMRFNENEAKVTANLLQMKKRIGSVSSLANPGPTDASKSYFNVVKK